MLFVGGEDVRMRIPLLLALRKRGFRVGAIGSEEGGQFSASGISYWRYNLHRWIGPLADWRALRSLRTLFEDIKPDVIHAFDTKPGMLAPTAATWANVPVKVRTITGMGYVFSSYTPASLVLRPIYRLFQRRASADSSMTLFQNIDDQIYFRERGMVSPENSELVPGSGVDFDALESIKSSEEKIKRLRDALGLGSGIVVTMVARMVRQKGVIEFLRAAELVRRHDKEVNFLLVGPISGEGRQAIPISLIMKYSDSVNYLGMRHDIPDILSISDLFVLPTYYREGVPRVILEACGLGVPVITTDMPGCRDVVRHGYNGWVVPKRDEAALAETIKMVGLMDETQRKSFGMRGRSYVRENFSLDNVADAYSNIYIRQLRKSK